MVRSETKQTIFKPQARSTSHKTHQPNKISINNKLRSLRFLHDGLSKYFSTKSKKRAVFRSPVSSPTRMIKDEKVKKVAMKQATRGDCAEMLVDGLSDFFKVSSPKRKSMYRDSLMFAKSVCVADKQFSGQHFSRVQKRDASVKGRISEESLLEDHTTQSFTSSSECKSHVGSLKGRNKIQQSQRAAKRTRITNSIKKKALGMRQKFKNCRLLNGLYDGLSHLYATQGMRQRKSLYFYRDKLSRNKMKNEIKVVTSSSDTPVSSPTSSKVIKRINSPVHQILKTPKPTKNVDASKKKDGDTCTSYDYALFKKAVKGAVKFLDQQDKVADKSVSKWPAFIEIGQYEVATWYSSPYPNEYSNICKLYICEFCLKYTKSQETLSTHLDKCQVFQPPGKEIYQEGSLSVYEVDGNVNKSFCQNLCLLAKLYLQHKTLYHDVEPFLFYVLTITDSRGCHIVGYFSKEKYCQQKFNLSCLMTLPQYQRQGYGRFLIEFSYLLSRKEGVPGTPEKPLSDLGKLSYFSYWKSVVVDFIHQHEDDDSISIEELSNSSGIEPEDLLTTLESLGMIGCSKDSYVIVMNKRKVHEMSNNSKLDLHIKVNEEKLKWEPNIFVNATDKCYDELMR